jgi:hypothetical protein
MFQYKPPASKPLSQVWAVALVATCAIVTLSWVFFLGYGVFHLSRLVF